MKTTHNLMQAVYTTRVVTYALGGIDTLNNEADILRDMIKVMCSAAHTLKGAQCYGPFGEMIEQHAELAEQTLDRATEKLKETTRYADMARDMGGDQ